MFRQWLVCCWTCSVIAYSSAAGAAAEGRRYRSSSPGGQVRARQGGREESTCAGNGTWRSAYQPAMYLLYLVTWEEKMGGVVTKSGFTRVLLLPGVPPHFLTDPDLSEWRCDLETIHCLCNPGHGPHTLHQRGQLLKAYSGHASTRDSAGMAGGSKERFERVRGVRWRLHGVSGGLIVSPR